MLCDWFRQRSGQKPRGPARGLRPRRTRAFRTEIDCLEGRSLLSATSAVAWTTGDVTHSAFYAVGLNDNVEVSGGGGFTNLGGYARQVSAGLDAFNKPEVNAIGADNAVSVNKGSGWVSLGGYVTELSGPTAGNAGVSLPAGLVNVVGKGHGASLHKGTSFFSLTRGTAE
jgi:hypothetical protein